MRIYTLENIYSKYGGVCILKKALLTEQELPNALNFVLFVVIIRILQRGIQFEHYKYIYWLE